MEYRRWMGAVYKPCGKPELKTQRLWVKTGEVATLIAICAFRKKYPPHPAGVVGTQIHCYLLVANPSGTWVIFISEVVYYAGHMFFGTY
jgi:Na+-transporting NADH:ubiquinone oxidoreductase subunit NqrA